VTLNLSGAKNHGCRTHPRGSVRRPSGFVLTGNPELIRLKAPTGIQDGPQISRRDAFDLSVQCQAAAVRMFLCFFGLAPLASISNVAFNNFNRPTFNGLEPLLIRSKATIWRCFAYLREAA
jgi:hypothetical protein